MLIIVLNRGNSNDLHSENLFEVNNSSTTNLERIISRTNRREKLKTLGWVDEKKKCLNATARILSGIDCPSLQRPRISKKSLCDLHIHPLHTIECTTTWENQNHQNNDNQTKFGAHASVGDPTRNHNGSAPLPLCGCESVLSVQSIVTTTDTREDPTKFYDSFQARIHTDKTSQYDERKQGKSQGRPIVTWRTHLLTTLLQKSTLSYWALSQCIKQGITVKSRQNVLPVT